MAQEQLKEGNTLSDRIYDVETALKSLKNDQSIHIGIFATSGYVNNQVQQFLSQHLQKLKTQFDQL